MVAVLVIDTYSADLELFYVPRHAAAEQMLRQTAIEFWQNMADQKFPHPDYTRDGETIDRMHPEASTETVDLRNDNRLPVVLAERQAAVEAGKAADARVDAADAEIKAKIGSAEEALIDGWKITWRMQERAAFTVPASSFRVLRIREWKR
jgi:hypothetical protein